MEEREFGKDYIEDFDYYTNAIVAIDYKMMSGKRAAIACFIAFVLYLSLYAICGWTWIPGSLASNILIDVGISIGACPIGMLVDHVFLSMKRKRLEMAFSMAKKRYWDGVYH